MAFRIHPQARASLFDLDLPGPIKKMYYTESACRFDLSNSTNPYAGAYREYPSLDPLSLKQTYLHTLKYLNSLSFPTLPFPSLTPDHLLFTVGSIEGIDIVLRAFSEPHKDSIGVLDPTFPAYAHWAKIHGIGIKSIPLKGEDFSEPDVEKVLKANPKILFICSPNNPTGTVVSPETIFKICQVFKGLVVVDEAYIEFADQPSVVCYLPQAKNLIVLRTLSKGWGMAGLRCGIVLADPSIIYILRYIQIPFGLSMPAQRLIKRQLQNPGKLIESWKSIKDERDRLFTLLSSMPAIQKIYKSQANFLLMQLQDFQSSMKKLKDADVYVADCTHALPNSIKVSIAEPQAHEVFLRALSL